MLLMEKSTLQRRIIGIFLQELEQISLLNHLRVLIYVWLLKAMSYEQRAVNFFSPTKQGEEEAHSSSAHVGRTNRGLRFEYL